MDIKISIWKEVGDFPFSHMMVIDSPRGPATPLDTDSCLDLQD